VDCIRDHGSLNHDPVDHRLLVHESDMVDSTATYYFEGAYLVLDDVDRLNNLGSKRCKMRFTGYAWDFDTPVEDNPLVLGWTMLRWSELDQSTVISSGPDDGDFVVGVGTWETSPGIHRYEYIAYNFDSDRGAHAFTVPLPAGVTVSNVGFHDPDTSLANEWNATVWSDRITWATDDYATDSLANYLGYYRMFNFRFDADAAPAAGTVGLTIFKPGGGPKVFGETLVPGGAVVSAPVSPPPAYDLAISSVSPNPFNPSGLIDYSLPHAGDVSLTVVDLSGRLVRSLFHGVRPAGEHRSIWNGLDEGSRPVASGVYLIRLESRGEVRTRKITLLR
jgi:hypothetical protein